MCSYEILKPIWGFKILCSCSPKIRMLNRNPQWDGIRRCDLWDIIRFRWGWRPHNETCVLYKKSKSLELSAPRCKAVWKRALRRTWLCWHPDLGLPSLQDCEKYSSFKPPNQWYFVTAVSQTKTSWKCLFPQCQIQTFSSNHELGNWPDIIKNMFKKCHLLPAQTSCLETLGVCSGGSVPPQAQSPSAIGLRQLCDEWWEQESGKIPNLKLHLKKLEKGTIKTQSN